MNWLAVAVGGAIGSVLRYFITQQVGLRLSVAGIPWGTMLVNFIGAFVIGFVAVYVSQKASPLVKPFLMVGFLGGLTTYSSFSLESFHLIHQMEYWRFVVYTSTTFVGCMLLTALGWLLGQWSLVGGNISF